MAYQNSVSISGNLGSDPKYIQSKKNDVAIAVFSIANTVTRYNSDLKQYEKIHTNWIPVKLFGDHADLAVKSLKKGNFVNVFGKLRSHEYSSVDGKKATGFEVVADWVVKEQFATAAASVNPGVNAGPNFEDFKDSNVTL